MAKGQNLLSSLFNKNNNKEQITPAAKVHITDTEEFKKYVREIEKILQIEAPSIQSVACIFEYNNQIMAQIEFIRSEIPENVNYNGAYYLDENDLIIIARKYPKVDYKTQELKFKNLTLAENLFSIAHELRHAWQKKYHEDIYYKTNAVNLENINDIAEIDADAFAIAYVFSKMTPFTSEDFPNHLSEICIQGKLDGGKRWERAHKLSYEYHFGNADKIDEAKNGADEEEVNYFVGMAKLNGLI